MKRYTAPLVLGVTAAIFIVWLSRHTQWTDVELPTFPKGEALTNPFYATQRFAEGLGARTTRDRVFTTPPADAILVLSRWHWNLTEQRRVAIERWVASGGRLVVDRALMGGQSEFEAWSGIVRRERKHADSQPQSTHLCDQFRQERAGVPDTSVDARLHWICDFDSRSTLIATRASAWALSGSQGAQAMRVDAGKGSVTVINASPFRDRSLFDADHGWLFVAATQLRRGDELHFLSEEDRTSLVGLIWLYGKPVVLPALVLVGFVLWRDSVRLGPLTVRPTHARRSLAEQIRGTGRFALRCGGGESLHAACARALEEAATRRVSGYRHLNPRERAASIAELTGFDRDGLNAAIHHPGQRHGDELRDTIEMLETARRMLIATRRGHGTS